jgi:hypothetical protein
MLWKYCGACYEKQGFGVFVMLYQMTIFPEPRETKGVLIPQCPVEENYKGCRRLAIAIVLSAVQDLMAARTEWEACEVYDWITTEGLALADLAGVMITKEQIDELVSLRKKRGRSVIKKIGRYQNHERTRRNVQQREIGVA